MLTLVRNDQGDWIGVYGHDGRLIEQTHSFEESRVLELAGVAHDVVSDVDLDDSAGHLPTTLGEVAHLPGAQRRREVRP
jgi:hypothetical protein